MRKYGNASSPATCFNVVGSAYVEASLLWHNRGLVFNAIEQMPAIWLRRVVCSSVVRGRTWSTTAMH